ncbi:hypothetical protein GCM10010249_20090 [Streptomyces roseolilacinus]|uniref:Uncharacterized protein n=1 Tax=Streptomyces roseolilacinus TaxID=66904 RepID=A0A918AYH7_9ACTN|nr:hypothetical protein GCM10010249_20090 [Streptomyces roseolilacinus]
MRQAPEPVGQEDFESVPGDDGKVGQSALDMCPYALDRIEVGRVDRQQEHLPGPRPRCLFTSSSDGPQGLAWARSSRGGADEGVVPLRTGKDLPHQ